MAVKKLPNKNAWNDKLEHQLTEIQHQLQSLGYMAGVLRAAKHYDVTPEHLTTLVATQYQKNLKLMEKVAVWVREQGGTFVQGKKHADGTIYSWKVKFQLDGKIELLFDIGRYHGLDIYDKALDFEAMFIPNKSRTRRQFVDHDSSMHDLETIADIKRWYKTALKEHAAMQKAALKK